MSDGTTIDWLMLASFSTRPAHLDPGGRPAVSVEITGRYLNTDMDASFTLALHPESAGELIVGLQKALVSLAMEQREEGSDAGDGPTTG